MSDLRTATMEPLAPCAETLSTTNQGAMGPPAARHLDWPRAFRAFGRAWRLVRWKMVAIITLTLSSTLLVACLSVATLNVVLRLSALKKCPTRQSSSP
jgi:hypothetical protein